jgi:hypothetical protein
MGEGGEVLKPGPLDLVHRHPDIPVNVPLRNAGGPQWQELPRQELRFYLYCDWRASGCYRLAGGAWVHVKPECRC